MAGRSRNGYSGYVMYKPLVLELTLPLQQPLDGVEFEEVLEEPAWEPTVRVVVFDDSPRRSSLPRNLELREQA
jgi:hypothetical protein